LDVKTIVEVVTLAGLLFTVAGHWFTARAELKGVKEAFVQFGDSLKEVDAEIRTLPVQESRIKRLESQVELLDSESKDHGEKLARLEGQLESAKT